MVDIADRAVARARRGRRGAPGTHALVIGVSHYRHLAGGARPSPAGMAWGMAQLSCAAASAARVARWLASEYHNPAAPLRTLRVLLSPQRGERIDRAIAPHVRGAAHRATRGNVEAALAAFKADCEARTDDVAFVYVAGHGVQLTKHEATVLLEDVGDPRHVNSLQGAIDMVGCHAGLDHAGAAATQFWFVDACRQYPDIAEQFEAMTGALSLDERPGSARASPCFLAAATREAAFARPGKQTLFCEALLDGLSRTAIVGPDRMCPAWHVSSYSLHEELKQTVDRLAAAEGEVQTVSMRGSPAHAVLHRLARPPEVDLRVDLKPAEATRVTSASLLLDASTPVPGVPRRWPLRMRLPAGLYLLNLTTRAPFQPVSDILQLVPPSLAVEKQVS